MAYSVGFCKEMAKVSAEKKLHLATGHQRHYSVLYDNAVDLIKRGLLGRLHHIRAQWHRTQDSWYQPLPNDKMRKDLEDFEKKLVDAQKKKDMARAEAVATKIEELRLRLLDEKVDAPKYGYEAKKLAENGQTYEASALEELIRWRLWTRTGGGLMAELGSHQLDASGIFCSAIRTDGKKARPLTVSATGGRHYYPLDREAEDHVYCTYEYPGADYDADPNKKIVVTYSSINGSGYGGYGEVVMGDKGTLILEREQEALLFGDSTSTSVTVTENKGKPALSSGESGYAATAQAATAKAVSRGYTEEMEHFAWCIRNFDFEVNRPKCHPEVAMADAVIALTTNIAIRTNRRIEFKPEWFDLSNPATPEEDLKNPPTA
jgi:predicted dehydrogenase